MVLPTEEKDFIGKTLEDRLADKFDLLQMSREQRNNIAFDEVARSIEVLLKAIPDAYNLLMIEKNELDKDLDEKLDDIERRADSAGSKIQADAIRSNESFMVQWDYREVYEEVIIELLQQFKLIPIRNPIYGSIESVQEEPIEPIQEPPVQSPPPQQLAQKPKLSIRKEKVSKEGFKV